MSAEAPRPNLFTGLRHSVVPVLNSLRGKEAAFSRDWANRQESLLQDDLFRATKYLLGEYGQSMSPKLRRMVEDVLIERGLKIMYGSPAKPK